MFNAHIVCKWWLHQTSISYGIVGKCIHWPSFFSWKWLQMNYNRKKMFSFSIFELFESTEAVCISAKETSECVRKYAILCNCTLYILWWLEKRAKLEEIEETLSFIFWLNFHFLVACNAFLVVDSLNLSFRLLFRAVKLLCIYAHSLCSIQAQYGATPNILCVIIYYTIIKWSG